MGPNKLVHVMFMSGGIILFLLLYWTGDWVWGYFTRHPNEYLLQLVAGVMTLGIGVTVYKNQRVYGLANEVAAELKKVTWPTWKETRAATLVVIVTVFIAAVILGLFDAVWSWFTDRIYG
jgi:preprotein translocase subunit SecE